MQDNHFFIVMALLTLVIIVVSWIGIRLWQKHQTQKSYVKNRSLIKSTQSIDELVDELQCKIDETDTKIKNGEIILEKLMATLREANHKTKHIKVGLIPPVFNHDDSEKVKETIILYRQNQYQCIADNNATEAYTEWSWFGDKKAGNKMTNDYRMLILHAYNAEFEVIRKQMRVNKLDAAYTKLGRLDEQLGKLGETANVSLTKDYTRLKFKELKIWHDDLVRKSDLKQERKIQQETIREQNKVNNVDTEALDEAIAVRDIEIQKAQKKAKLLAGQELESLKKLIAKIESEKTILEEKFLRATSQAQLTRSGFIYVISNVGCFGADVVKIGMTRRLEPMERVNELGDASVPFKFDVHTLAYVNDAPKIEKALHDKFTDKRVNVDNFRKEFFRVPVAEIKEAMDNMGIESDWYFNTEAKEYSESMLIREAEDEQVRIAHQNKADILPESI